MTGGEWVVILTMIISSAALFFITVGWATAYMNNDNKGKERCWEISEIEFYPVLVCILFTPIMLLFLCIIARAWRYGWTLEPQTF